MNRDHLVRVIGVAAIVAGLAQTSLGAQQGQQGQQGQGQQGQQTPQAAQPEPVRVALKLVVEKLEGTKVASSIPFELMVKSGRGGQTTLNHGRSVAVPQTTFGNDRVPTTTFNYQSIGSNIVVSDMAVTDKLISFVLMMDISTVDPAPNPAVPASLTFRRYSMQSPLSVRPNEPTTVTVSTDSIAAETIRLTVTASVVR